MERLLEIEDVEGVEYQSAIKGKAEVKKTSTTSYQNGCSQARDTVNYKKNYKIDWSIGLSKSWHYKHNKGSIK